MATTPPDKIEGQISSVIAASALPIEDMLNDPVLLHKFVEDMAQGIYPASEIAKRYSLDPQDVVRLIRENAELRRRIQVRRAIWQSDDNIETRIRKYAGTTILEALPANGAMMFDRSTPAATRLDTLKAFSRMAGVDSQGAGGNREASQGPGNQFTVNFHFSGGRIERVSTTVENQPAPAITDQ